MKLSSILTVFNYVQGFTNGVAGKEVVQREREPGPRVVILNERLNFTQVMNQTRPLRYA